MYFEFCIVGLLALLVLRVFRMYFGSTIRTFPPGPNSLPVIGNLHQLASQPSVKIQQMSQLYGDVVGLHLGSTPMVVLHDPLLTRKVYADSNTAGRPQRQILNMFFKGKGLSMSEGPLWEEHRRFAITTLRSLGMGKSWLEQSILEEVQEITQQFRAHNGESFDPRRHLTLAVSNVICALIFGRRFDHSDGRFIWLCNKFAEYLAMVDQLLPVQAFPFLKLIPGLKFRGIFKKLVTSIEEIKQFTEEIIREHKSLALGEESTKKDYIMAFLDEQRKQDDGQATFDDEQLTLSIVNLFTGGTETSAATLLWSMIYLAKYPDVQYKIHEELDTVLAGNNNHVTFEDRHRLRYTDACLHDIQRLTSAAPMSLPHTNFEPMQINGYIIPSQTILHHNTYAMHMDKRYWSKPEDLCPEHFLNAANELVIPPAFLPFSTGKRACPGEALAKMTTFLFFANLLRHFEIVGDFGHLDYLTKNMTLGIVNSPAPFEIKMIRRL